jgi:GR25 family glycosyltransferase involved in LPS biosynthesis
MKINFKEIPKFVINLDRRPDRLESVKEEFSYIGWDFERFSAVDTNSYEGCAYSHQKIAQIILERGYDYAMVFEDDIFFMPYAKKLIPLIEQELSENEWEFFHFAPSIHRPLNKFSENLVDLTNLPPKDPDRHRGIFGTSGFILTKKSAEYVTKWNTNDIIENTHMQVPIDEFLDRGVYPNMQSFSAKLPLVVQKSGYSDINKTMDSNHYIMTYNWNVYFPDKLESVYLDHGRCVEIRNQNEN